MRQIQARWTMKEFVHIVVKSELCDSPEEKRICEVGLSLRVPIADPPRNVNDVVIKLLPNFMEKCLFGIEGRDRLTLFIVFPNSTVIFVEINRPKLSVIIEEKEFIDSRIQVVKD